MLSTLKLSKQPKDCEDCTESKIERMLLLKETRLLETQIQNLSLSKHRLQNKLNNLKSSLLKLGNGRLISDIPATYLKKTDLFSYYLNLKLPTSIFEILKSQEDSIAYLLQSGLYIPAKTCECGKFLKLEIIEYNEHIFKCPCSRSYKFFSRSIWERFDLPSEKILLFIFLWLLGLKHKHLRHFLTLQTYQSRTMEDFLLDLITNNFLSNFEKFSGVVEIDESSFKHSTTSRSKTQPERWVFGLFERKGKRNYMEVVTKRTAGILIPIIQKICEPGTTIISDQWAAYKKLSDVGFPHYTVDHSRFFVNPNSREIHTQNIELSWCWAKFEIKRQNRHLAYLQKFLHVYCWKRQFKSEDKINEIGLMFQEVSKMIIDLQNKGAKKE